MQFHWTRQLAMAACLACGAGALQAAAGHAENAGKAGADAAAGTANGATQKADAAFSAAERGFMVKAAASGLYEVEVSTLAGQKAATPAAKAFADMLVKHHTEANSELMQIGSRQRLALPPKATLPADKQAVISRLSKLSGPAFDRDYLRTVGIADHQRDIRLFEEASRTARNPALKAWVDKTLPVLRQHLSQAQQIPLPTATP
ncbi:MAG: hypothetical protein JWR68_1284 [Polaromonas sp.]|nr:hypothetical protein [Polaromonas sp.]